MTNSGTTTEVATVKVGAKRLLSITDKEGEVFTRLTHRNYTHVCVTDVSDPRLGFVKFGWNKVVTWHSSLKNAKPASHLKGCGFYVVEVVA